MSIRSIVFMLFYLVQVWQKPGQIRLYLLKIQLYKRLVD